MNLKNTFRTSLLNTQPSRVDKARSTIVRARGPKFSREQLEFLERKKTGTMPYSCTACAGCGSVTCKTCSGTGQNAAGVAERLFDLKAGVHRRAPDLNINYLFMEEMPCFICKGVGSAPCSSCSGTGIADFASKFSPTD
jgi:hypothetical protein